MQVSSSVTTILFTDLEGSRRLWDELPDGLRGALGRHDGILREAVEKRGGEAVEGEDRCQADSRLTFHDAVRNNWGHPLEGSGQVGTHRLCF